MFNKLNLVILELFIQRNAPCVGLEVLREAEGARLLPAGETDSWQGGVPRPHSPATSEDIRSPVQHAEMPSHGFP